MKRIVLKATEGMVLTNGEVFGKIIYPGDNENLEKWYEITEEEYQDQMAMREAKPLMSL